MENVGHLLKLSDEYQVKGIFDHCVKFLEHQPKTEGNVIKIMILASLYNLGNVLEGCYPTIREMKRQQSLDNGISESQAKSPEEDVSVDVVNSPESSSDVSEPHSDGKSDVPVDELNLEIGDKVQVKYGRGRNHRLYDAKVWSTC